MSPNVPPAPQSIDGEQLYHQGVQASQKGDIAGALALLDKATATLPDRGDIAYNYGVVLQQAGRLHDAVRLWQRAANLSPQHSVIWVNLALGLSQMGQNHEANQTYTLALAKHPHCRELLYHAALFLHKTGAFAASLAAFETLLSRHPDDQAAWINAGKTAKALGDFQKAASFYDKAITLGGPHLAVAHFHQANLALLQGKWAEGFAEYEWRLDLPEALPAPWGLPAFHDDLPAGSRVLLWSDQGLGDALMYLRFVPQLAARGYELFLFVQTPLKPLLANHPFLKGVFEPKDAPLPMDAALALGSLPHILQCDPQTSWQAPYITTQTPAPLPSPSGTKRVGLVWAGNPKHENDAQRSLDLSVLAPLFAMQGLEWFSLQLGPRRHDITQAGLAHRIHDLADKLTDFGVTAAIVNELDLVLTVDTAMAHLAGAMGKPVWTLLPAQNGDWRWGLSGETSFWYPSMRLFRPSANGDWLALLETMGNDLRQTSP